MNRVQSYRARSIPFSKRMESVRLEAEKQIEQFAERTKSYETPVPGLRMGVIRSPQPFLPFFYEASLCVCLRGSKKVLIGDATFIQDKRVFQLTTVGVPTLVSVPGASTRNPYVALNLALDLELAGELITEMEIEGFQRHGASPGLALGEMTEPLLDSIYRMVSLANNPADVPILHRNTHRELLYRLLTLPIGARLKQIVRAGSVSSRTAKAISWLRHNYVKKTSVSDLAKIAGMASPTLFRRFREITTLSPLQYQKLLRLEEARRLMLTDNLDTAAAAYAVGYESVSQFNREYHRLYGNPPARHTKLIRESSSESSSVGF